MSKFCTCIFEEIIARLPKINSLRPLLRRIGRIRWLQFWVSQDHLGGLEKYHFASNVLNDVVGTLKGCDEARLCGFLLLKVHGHIVKKIHDQIIAVLQIYQ